MSSPPKAKKGNAFGRLFKSKKKAPLSSQDSGVGSIEENADDSFLLNNNNSNNNNDHGNEIEKKQGKKKKKSRFRRNNRSTQNSPSVSLSLSNKENEKSFAAVSVSDGAPLPHRRCDDINIVPPSQSDVHVSKKEQMATSSPRHSSRFQPFYDFNESRHCNDQVGFQAPSDEIGDPFSTNAHVLHNKANAPVSPQTPKSRKSKTAAMVSTPEIVGFNCTFKDAWSVFCSEKNTNGNGNIQNNDESEAAEQFQVRVDVLEDLRASLGEQGNSFRNDENESLASEEKKRKSELLVLTRSALSRPFGRTSLPARLAKAWVVEVTFAGFDKGRNMCTYNIMVQKEEYNDSGTPIPSPRRSAVKNELSMGASFVTASIDRTLQDFLWLEEAMMQEYNGSLIFPILSLALTSGTNWAGDKDSFKKGEWDPLGISMEMLNNAMRSKEPIDTKLVAGWLTDVLNSIRGKGELILDHKFVDIIHSEAMESFLYMTSDPLPKPSRKLRGKFNSSDSNWSLGDFKKALSFKETGQDDIQSTIAGLVKANLQCLGIMDDERTNEGSRDANETDSMSPRRTKNIKEQENMEMWRGLIQSNGLLAQRFYIAVQKENALRAMHQLDVLLDRESKLSAAWKRFAISLSMLFASEKDIENYRLEGVKSTSPSNSTRVGKATVDDNLRILARQKVDRSVPSLKVLSGMLNSYYSDFSSVDPSLREFAKGLDKLMKNNVDGTWQSQLKAMATLNLLNTVNNDSFPSSNSDADRHAMQERLSTNEEYMKSSIMQLCKAMKIRVCRMGWKFFKMESGQVSLLLSSAEQVRSNLKCRRIRNASIVENEKIDNEREAVLVRAIMELGLKRKYKYQPGIKSSASSNTSSETSIISDFDRSHEGDNETSTTDDGGTIPPPLLEPVMTFARERTGRWNEEAAVKILQASGIHNARFDVEIGSSSKSLRSVSKLVAALRESVTRCNDAVQMLQQVHAQVSSLARYVVIIEIQTQHILIQTFALRVVSKKWGNADRAVTP